MIFEILIYPGIVFVLVFSLIYSGILRKLAAHMQHRIGPPIWQPILDMIKLFGKESIVPEQAKPGFSLWPTVAFASIIIAGLLIPIAGITPIAFYGSIILLIYLLFFASLAIYLSGFSSSNPFGVVGSMRGLVQMIAYEFPFIVSMIVLIVFLDTLSPSFINLYQIENGFLALLFPFAAAAFFVSLLAETELPPFHTPNAHQEIVAGYATEFGGKRLAFLELTHIIKIFVLISLGVAFFFGGTNNILFFFIKTLILLFIIVAFRTILARLRIDQILKLCWLFGFIALIDLIRVMVFV